MSVRKLIAAIHPRAAVAVHDLLAAFRRVHPQYRRIFVETLPPGILARQIETGALVMGNLRIAVKPDVYTAGKKSIEERQRQHGWFAETYDYARNPLAILVAKGNPRHVAGLADLGRRDVRVSMPNPAWEGIARQIEAGDTRIGGIMVESHLVAGRQDLLPGKPLVYGQSITDGCIDWDTSVQVLERLARAAERRRSVVCNRETAPA